MNDVQLMRRALALAARAKGNTSPNPMVGAVVVAQNGEVLAGAYHERAGKQHAEAVALEKATARAAGGTLYVTLEPCAHHGRTAPCVDAIIAGGIGRVIAAAEDPDPRVAGEGFRRLRAAGIEVCVGLCHDQACDLNRAYYHHRSTGLPYVTLKMAQSLDGAIAERPGECHRLSGERARNFVRGLRYDNDVVMIGVGTAIVDDPQLTVRPYRFRAVPYIRLVVDSLGRLPLSAKLVTESQRAKTVVACTEAIPSQRRRALEDAGVGTVVCKSSDSGRVDLADLMKRLGRQETLSVLCEGGPQLAASLLEAGLVNELHWLIAPIILGTAAAAPVIAAKAPLRTKLRLRGLRRLGTDTWVNAVREA